MDAGRSITSPAAILFMRLSGRMVMDAMDVTRFL
jgi:hypothetical protein